MPADYYRDWLRVAAEEARHFELLREHLRSLSRDYGDFDAHDGLWTMVERTSQDVVARMALVPRTLEARGWTPRPPCRIACAEPVTCARCRNPGDHPARRGRPRRHRQSLVSLAVPARRTRSGADLRPVGAGTSCATAARPLQCRGPAGCGIHADRSGMHRLGRSCPSAVARNVGSFRPSAEIPRL